MSKLEVGVKNNGGIACTILLCTNLCGTVLFFTGLDCAVHTSVLPKLCFYDFIKSVDLCFHVVKDERQWRTQYKYTKSPPECVCSAWK